MVERRCLILFIATVLSHASRQSYGSTLRQHDHYQFRNVSLPWDVRVEASTMYPKEYARLHNLRNLRKYFCHSCSEDANKNKAIIVDCSQQTESIISLREAARLREDLCILIILTYCSYRIQLHTSLFVDFCW